MISFLDRQGLLHESKEEEFCTHLIVRHGAVRANINVYNTGRITVQGAKSKLKELLDQMKAGIEAEDPLPGQTLPFEIERFPDLVRERAPNVDPVVVRFIEEAINCLRSDALIASAFMLGAASEKAIRVLIDTYSSAIRDDKNKERFVGRINGRSISKSFDEFRRSFAGCQNRPTTDPLALELDTLIGGMFQFCRITRNEIGHPQIVPDLDKGVILANFAHFVTYIERVYALKFYFEENGVLL